MPVGEWEGARRAIIFGVLKELLFTASEESKKGRLDPRRGERPRAEREYWARSSLRQGVMAGITKASRVTLHVT